MSSQCMPSHHHRAAISAQRPQATSRAACRGLCVLVVCIVGCRAEKYDDDCHIFGQFYTAPGGDTIPTTGREYVGAKSALNVYCLGTNVTGCGDNVKASAHLEFYPQLATPPGAYSDSHTQTYPLSKLVGGSVDFAPIYFRLAGYYVIRFRRGVAADGELCPHEAKYTMRTRDLDSSLQREATIIDVSPPVVECGDTVTLTLQAPVKNGMDLFSGVDCIGDVVQTIAAKEKGTLTITLPDTEDYEFFICYKVPTSGKKQKTENSLRVFLKERAYYNLTKDAATKKKATYTFRVYNPRFVAGDMLKLINRGSECIDEGFEGTTETALIQVTECGRPVLKAIMTVAKQVDVTKAGVCVFFGSTDWKQVLDMNNLRPGFRSFARCGYTNECQNQTVCSESSNEDSSNSEVPVDL